MLPPDDLPDAGPDRAVLPPRRAAAGGPGWTAAGCGSGSVPEPVDLGGIGKGLAVRWAARSGSPGCGDAVLVEAGGDCSLAGTGPEGEGLAGRRRGPGAVARSRSPCSR